MTTEGYVYDQSWKEERARIAGMEALWDPGTQAILAGTGDLAGRRCLCVGAGGGSIVEWLAAQGASVLATDIDTRFLEPLASDAIEVRRLDIVADDLEREAFDLIHTRMVIEHLPQRDAALDRMAAALRPGGVLVVEDLDWTAFGFDPADEVDRRTTEGIIGFMAAAGFDATYGRRVVSDLTARGLATRGEGRMLAIDFEHPGSAFFRLSFEQLAPHAVQGGFLDEEDAKVAGERINDPERRVLTPVLMAGIGRRAG